MKVVLRSDVAGVGRRGDMVDVAAGFARNRLFPAGLAIAATDKIEAQAQAMRRSRDLRDTKDKEAAQTKADALNSLTLTLSMRAGETGRLFGSVGPAEVIKAVREASGIELDRHQVHLDEHIKEVGNHEVAITLLGDVRATVKLTVSASA